MFSFLTFLYVACVNVMLNVVVKTRAFLTVLVSHWTDYVTNVSSS